MPAQSQQQQKLFGLALAVKRGEVSPSEVSDEVRDIVDRMSEKDIEDFASTSHKGLPKKVEQQIREMVREIMRERAISELELSKDDMDKLHSDGEVEVDGEKVTFEEAASRTAMEIGGLTGMNKDAIQKFVDDNNLDIEKVFQYVKKGKLKDRMDLVSAIAGKPNNPVQKKMIKMFGESVNEALNPDEKRFRKMAKQGKPFVVNYFTKRDVILKRKKHSEFWCKTRTEAEKFLKSVEKAGGKGEIMKYGYDDPSDSWGGKAGPTLFLASVNEGYSTEEKRIVLMAVKKIAKYMNVDMKTAMGYVLGAGQELERDIERGKIK